MKPGLGEDKKELLYYPFGMMMPGRRFTSQTGYRYGFNGKEKDNEIKGEGNSYEYGMRMYDSRIGRPFSVDPYAAKYPHLSIYQFFSNNPILNIDLDGLEGVDYTKNSVLYSNGKPRFQTSDANNTAKIPLYTFMINGTMHILHNGRDISFNPSSAPTALGMAFNPGYYYALNIKSFSSDLVSFTDNQLPGMVTKNTGVADNLARGGFSNTFRHFAWQSLISMSLGENIAKRAGDYHEADGIKNTQNGEFRKDNIIDLVNNEYAREYGKNFNFNEVTKDAESFAGYVSFPIFRATQKLKTSVLSQLFLFLPEHHWRSVSESFVGSVMVVVQHPFFNFISNFS